MRFLTLVSMTVSCAAFVGSLAFADSREPPVLQQLGQQGLCPSADSGCVGSTQSNRQAAPPQDADLPVFPGHFATPFFPLGCSLPGKLAVATAERVFGDYFWSADSGAMWTKTADPPNYGSVYYGTDVVAPSPEFDHDRTLFIGGDGSQAVWRSNDGGWTWHSSNPPITGRVVDIEVSPAFAVDGTVFAVTTEPIFRSTDRGVTWQELARPPRASPSAEIVLSSHYAVDNTVVVRLNDSTLWRTRDTGATWTRVDEGLGTNTGNTVTDLDVAAVGSNSVVLLAATAANLSVSYDFGDTWVTLTSKTFSAIEAPDQPGPALLVFALRDSQAVVTYDTGQTWTPISTEWNLRDLALSPSFAHDQTVYICGDSGMWVTHDAGRTWLERPVVIGRYEGVTRLALVPSPQFEDDGVIFAVPEEQDWLLRSTDGGRAWTRLTLPGPAAKPLMALSPAFATDHIAFLVRGQQVFRSDDRGSSWSSAGDPLPGPVDALSLSPGFPSDSQVFAAVSYGGLYRSGDRGATWTLISGGQLAGRFITDLDISPGYPVDPTIFVSTYNDGVFRSDDGGFTWTNVTPFYRIRLAVALSPAFTTDHTLFIGETGFSEGGAYVSHDRGQTWTQIGGDLLRTFVHTVVVSPQFAQDQTVIYTANGTTPLISEDAGATWSRMTGIFPAGHVNGDFQDVAFTIVDGTLVPWASGYADVYRYQWPLTLSSSKVAVAVRAGSTTPVETSLRLRAEGPEQATWTASEAAGWLSLNPVSGNLPALLTLTVDSAQLTTTSRTEVTVNVPWTPRHAQLMRVPVTAYYFSHDLWLPLVIVGAMSDIRSSPSR